MKILEVKLMLLFQLVFQLQNAVSSFEDSASEVEDTKENESAASSQEHKHRHIHRSGHRHKKSHSHDHAHDYEHEHAWATSTEYDDCECACNKCDPPSDCCQSACKTCPSNPYQQLSRGMTSQSSVVFVPYPYPMMMPSPISTTNHHEIMRAHDSNTTQEPTTTSPATSTTTITTTDNLTDLINSEHNSNTLEQVLKGVVDDYSNIITRTPGKMQNGNNNYVLTSLRRTKPTWMPKYGIVPISDSIAEKLISKISRARALRSQQKRDLINERTLGKKL